jgi:hypothetical protein
MDLHNAREPIENVGHRRLSGKNKVEITRRVPAAGESERWKNRRRKEYFDFTSLGGKTANRRIVRHGVPREPELNPGQGTVKEKVSQISPHLGKQIAAGKEPRRNGDAIKVKWQGDVLFERKLIARVKPGFNNQIMLGNSVASRETGVQQVADAS